MTFRELQKLISKRYNLDVATANEIVSALIRDDFWNFENMTPEQVDDVLALSEAKASTKRVRIMINKSRINDVLECLAFNKDIDTKETLIEYNEAAQEQLNKMLEEK